MRAFVALELPDEMRSEVAAVSRRLALACEGRFVPYENYHVTLAFLGEIGEAQGADAVGVLDTACAGVGPIELRAEGLGKFGRSQNATLWMGLAATPELVGLAERVRGELSARGLPFEDKPFRPHVTLGRRVRIPRGQLPVLEFPLPAAASRVTLFRSILSQQGAEYKPLYTVELE